MVCPASGALHVSTLCACVHCLFSWPPCLHTHALCACIPSGSLSQRLSTCRLIIGPVSSIFDVAMFLVLWNFFRHDKPSYYNTISFQTGWFLESLLSQVGICPMVRAMDCFPSDLLLPWLSWGAI